MKPVDSRLNKGDTLGIDPRSLMRLGHLEFRARVVVEGFLKGLHRSPFHGFSVEFSEYRQYSPGDDVRYLDWRLYARSDRYHVKKFEEETNLRCYLLVDQSRSMEFGTLGYSKAEYARTLAATLAYFLNRQGDAVGVLTFDAAVREFLPARNRTGHLRRLMLTLDLPGGGESTDLGPPLDRILELVRKRGLMVLISDLFAPPDRLEAGLARLAACGHEVVLFHVQDPAETDFSFEAAMVFEDMESGRRLYIDPSRARSAYLQRQTEQRERVAQACLRLGIHYAGINTKQPLELVLVEFLNRRHRKSGERRTPAH